MDAAVTVLQVAIAVHFGVAAWIKIQDGPAAMVSAVAAYRLVPAQLERPSGLLVVATEVATVGAVILGAPAIGGLLGVILTGSFAIASGLNLARGRLNDCGCLGKSLARPLSLSLLSQQLVLFVMCASVLMWPGVRLSGIDGIYLSAAGAAVGLLLLFWSHVDAVLAAFPFSDTSAEERGDAS